MLCLSWAQPSHNPHCADTWLEAHRSLPTASTPEDAESLRRMEQVAAMPHHFTKLTTEARFWCNPCGRETMHRIDGGRRGPCLVCLEKREKQMSLPGTEQPQATQDEMFSLDTLRKDVG